MPGHKGNTEQNILPASINSWDVTELPGSDLDQLCDTRGVLAGIEERAQAIWGSGKTFISVNGSSAGIMASMIAACSSHGKNILVPRNLHRSAVHGLILSGLNPVWYEPAYDEKWGFYTEVSSLEFEKALANGEDICAALVVSPTYTGSISNIENLARTCHSYKVPLIVDEAHGAHLLGKHGMPASAISLGADIVVQSLHKTLPALTQTAFVHNSKTSLIDAHALRSALNLVHTSSPSYPLMISIEETLSLLEGQSGKEALQKMVFLCEEIKQQIKPESGWKIFKSELVDPAHIVIAYDHINPHYIYDQLCGLGIYPEAVFGQGVLLLLGTGSTYEHVQTLISCLKQIKQGLVKEQHNEVIKPEYDKQVFSPRQAYFMPGETVSAINAVGKIAAECIAPCPPGIPIVVPGQKISQQIMSYAVDKVKVVVEANHRSGEN